MRWELHTDRLIRRRGTPTTKANWKLSLAGEAVERQRMLVAFSTFKNGWIMYFFAACESSTGHLECRGDEKIREDEHGGEHFEKTQELNSQKLKDQ
jgi:hypothetical protein